MIFFSFGSPSLIYLSLGHLSERVLYPLLFSVTIFLFLVPIFSQNPGPPPLFHFFSPHLPRDGDLPWFVFLLWFLFILGNVFPFFPQTRAPVPLLLAFFLCFS